MFSKQQNGIPFDVLRKKFKKKDRKNVKMGQRKSREKFENFESTQFQVKDLNIVCEQALIYFPRQFLI